MEQKKLFQIKFKSFLGLCVQIALPLGIIQGLLAFIMYSRGGEGGYTDLPFFQFKGIFAGIANLIIGPVLFVLGGTITGVLGYIPFKFYLKIRKGINIDGEWEKNK